MSLSIFNDPRREAAHDFYERFVEQRVLERLRFLDDLARTSGLDSIDLAADPIIQLGMEVDRYGRVTKNSLGVYSLAWQAAEHPEWPSIVEAEVQEIRQRILDTHGVPLRFLIWAGMGGSIEDKSAYNAAGLLKGGPRLYSLDSTDPLKLKGIIEDMQRISGESIAALLPSTLVVGMAMGMTSYEPVVNLERLASLYEKFGIDSRPNVIYMTLPGSTLDQFAAPRGYRRVPLQLDDGNSTAGRHSAPLTRGSLYPLAFAGCDLAQWIAGTQLSDEEVETAWKLSAFLHAQGTDGRDKVTLMLPRSWAAAALWTKQDFEESLGKSEDLGIKIVIGERANPMKCRPVKDAHQDRVFLVVQHKREAHPDAVRIRNLRSAGYPIAFLTFPGAAPLSHYMQFMHYVVGGLGYLRRMNFVTQPSVELYKSIASEIFEEAKQAGGTANTGAWKSLAAPDPKALARELLRLAGQRKVEYGELTYFGDTRYNEDGRGIRESLERAADKIFRARLKMPVDIYEGPAMNHSYHEMIIGHGKCFSMVFIAAHPERFALAQYEPDYHMAQFLATKMALEKRHRKVVAIPVESVEALDRYFAAFASELKNGQV